MRYVRYIVAIDFPEYVNPDFLVHPHNNRHPSRWKLSQCSGQAKTWRNIETAKKYAEMINSAFPLSLPAQIWSCEFNRKWEQWQPVEIVSGQKTLDLD